MKVNLTEFLIVFLKKDTEYTALFLPFEEDHIRKSIYCTLNSTVIYSRGFEVII